VSVNKGLRTDLHSMLNWPLEGSRADVQKFHLENPTQYLHLKVGYRGWEGGPPAVPPFTIQICVLDFPHEFSENLPGCLPVAS